MVRLLVLGLALVLSPQAFAAAQMVYTNGIPYVDFGDGRVAVITHSMGKINHGLIGLRQIENTCDPGQALANCKIHMDFSSHSVGLRWSTHPDQSKIGAFVKKVSNSTPPSSYEIKDGFGLYTWFATQISGGNRRVLQAWTAEAMTRNPETGVDENRTISGGFNVELVQNTDGTLTIAKVGSSVNGDEAPPYISNSVSTMTFLAGNNQQCQVAFEVSIDSLLQQVKAPDFYKTDPATETPIKTSSVLNRKFTTVNSIRAALMPGVNLKEFE